MAELSSLLVFPPFRLDVESGTLWRDQQQRQLRPQVVALLHYLFTRAGLVVTKAELLSALWPGTTVSDGLLKTYIWEIRQALEESHAEPRFIETIPKRGYRFIGKVASSQYSVFSREEESQNAKVKTQKSKVNNFFPTPNPQHPTPVLVGREPELAHLHHSLANALTGKRQIVCVSGEAGIGKTSLVDTFVRQAGSDPKLWIGRGQCVEQYGAGEAYLPVLDALGRLGREAGKKRLIKVLRQHAPSWLVQLPSLIPPEERAILEHSLRNVTQDRMLREIADALEVLTSEQPLLLVMEDLHWSDPSTVELVLALARRREFAQLLVLVTYRFAESLPHNHLRVVPEEVQKHDHGTVVSLGLLNEEAVGEYLVERFAVGTDSSMPLRGLAHAIHQRTEGNPLFMRQTTDYLLTQGAIVQRHETWVLDDAFAVLERTIPQNTQQLIERQIERLSTEEHRLLEAASVVGIEFSAATIATALTIDTGQVEQWCESLMRRHLFLQASGTAPTIERRRASRYRFLHSLYSQVLYEQLTPTRRRQLHHQIAESLTTIYGERTQEFAGALANHFAHAHDYAQAVISYEQAAHKALQMSAPQEAVSHLTKSLDLLRLLPATPERDQQELGLLFTLAGPLIATKGYTSPEFAATFSRTRDLCRHTGDTYRLFVALLGLWSADLVLGQVHHAHQTAEELLQIADTIGDSGLQLSAHMAIGMALFYTPNLETARSQLQDGIVRYDRPQHSGLASIYGQDPGVTVLSYAAWTLWMLGYPDQARQHAEAARGLAQELSHPYSLTFALMFGAWIQVLRREPHEAQEWATSAMTIAAEHGFPYLVTAAKVSYGWARAAQGEMEDGQLYIREALNHHQEKGEELGRPYDLALLAQTHQQCGETAAALALLDEAFSVIERTGEHVYEAELYRLRGELTLAQESQKSKVSDTQSSAPSPQSLPSPQAPSLKPQAPSGAEQEAEGYFLKAIDIARQQHAKSLELRATISLARLWQQQAREHGAGSAEQGASNRLAQAHSVLSEVYNWFTEGFETADLLEAKALLDVLR